MRYLSTTEAAAILHVDPSRVRLLCKLGRIETIRVGNTYGIAQSEVERLAATARRPGRPRHSPDVARPPSAVPQIESRRP
jgi:excisionase family DNA binding protein